jgi:NADH-quinone oxidoreductase subunit E
LPGEQELAARKGEWTYEGQAGGTPAPDGTGAAGARPEGLAQARDGQPDDLKQIKGIGPKLERLLHSMGYFHYDQIAAWGPDEVAWVDENLEGFKGRVSRDDWVNQAKALAADRDGNTQ